MKYKITTIYNDKDVLKKINLSQLSRDTGLSYSFIMQLKNGEKIATQDTYEKIKKFSDVQKDLLY